MLEDTNGVGVFDKSTIFVDHVGTPMGELRQDGALLVASRAPASRAIAARHHTPRRDVHHRGFRLSPVERSGWKGSCRRTDAEQSCGRRVERDSVGRLARELPESVRTAAKPLTARIEERQAERIKSLNQMESLLTDGDVGRGRAVFFRTEIPVLGVSRHWQGGRHAWAGHGFHRGDPLRSRHSGGDGVSERQLCARLRADACGDKG